VQTTLAQYGIQTDLDQLKAQAASAIQDVGSDVLKNLVGTLAEVGGLILDIVLALVISLYLLADGPRFRELILALMPEQHRAKAQFVQDNGSRVLGGYLRAQFTLALIIGLLAGVGMSLLGLPYAVVLGVLAGLFELVPMFGPILSVIPAVIVALFMPFPTVVWVVLLPLISSWRTTCWRRAQRRAVGLHRSARCLRYRRLPAGAVGGLPVPLGWRAVPLLARPTETSSSSHRAARLSCPTLPKSGTTARRLLLRWTEAAAMMTAVHDRTRRGAHVAAAVA
jgi:hypothetical protein